MEKTRSSRFWSKVSLQADACWLWIGSESGKGYGQFYDGQRNVRAHRWSYARFVGVIPDGLYVCHACDTPNCVRPSHLFLGTQKDNIRDASSKGRVYKGGANVPWTRMLTHCKRGHSLSGDNLSTYSKRRVCKACMRLKWRSKP